MYAKDVVSYRGHPVESGIVPGLDALGLNGTGAWAGRTDRPRDLRCAFHVSDTEQADVEHPNDIRAHIPKLRSPKESAACSLRW